jgi:VWFA-related protein
MTALALVLTLAATQQPAVFSSEVEAVYVDVFVAKKGQPVQGLSAGDFVLKDNGVTQSVEIVDRSVVPTTAILAFDVSSSMAEGDKLVHLQEAARSFLRGMAPHDEAALVTFDQTVAVGQAPTTDRSAVLRALDAARPHGGTSVVDALFLCLERHWGPGRPLVVLFTDGEDSGSWLPNDAVLEAARESSALLYVVGTSPVTEKAGYVRLLRSAAETTGGAYLAAGSGEGLESKFLEILQATNARYILRYRPEGVERSGRHQIKIGVRGRGLKLRGRQEYFVAGSGLESPHSP